MFASSCGSAAELARTHEPQQHLSAKLFCLTTKHVRCQVGEHGPTRHPFKTTLDKLRHSVFQNPVSELQRHESSPSKRPLFRKAWLRISDHASPFFFGSGTEPGVQDNLVEVVRRNPAAATRLLHTTSLFSSIGNAISACSCFVFLWMHWQVCATCDRPLRWWLLLQACLQLGQLPVRAVLLYSVRGVEESGASLEDLVLRLTSSKAWHLSKKLAIFQYGWFVLGMVWWMHTDTCPDCPAVSKLMVAVMSLSAVRAAVAIGIFRALFREGDLNEVPATMGATKTEINALPAFRLTKTVENDQDAPCSICLSGFVDGTLLRRLPCGHEFHRHCIDKWLRRNKRCPLCMTSIDCCMPLRHRTPDRCK
ncbi:unnamed protein product [Symbiodinium natans]|uniref:RING-type domain-containing protein n=1 Tax=Symbiodinium natans TaxID=878477 RepID=A0A812RSU6_9DINO|nr:unnamed protein product [Symbiodinium natans]